MSETEFELAEHEIKYRLFHEIHVSEIRDYKKCVWAHDWKFKDQLYPLTTAKPLEFGTAMHLGLEYLMSPQYVTVPQEQLLTLSKSAFVTECKKQLASVPVDPFRSREEIEQDYKERIELGQKMLDYYAKNIRPVIDKDLEPLYTEKNFIVRLGELKCRCIQCYNRWEKWMIATEDSVEGFGFDGLPVVLEGKIDLILRDKNTNKVWIRDWKNVRAISDDYEWLENDEQLNLYLLALWMLGLDVAGFQYFELKKAVPQPPKVLGRRYQGRLLSTDKNQDTSFELMVEAIRANNEPIELYIDYLEFLKERGTDHYFKLNKMRRDEAAFKVFYENLVSVATEMIEHPKEYPTPTKFGCKFCEFRAPCIERMNGQDPSGLIEVMFEKRPHYYEVKDENSKYSL
ncbi:MAG TPA: PD-(D/E)XK nuclease family protein [Rectinema sp.]|nr:PD-(D/E)XK nuclease family protein [Rectinema sp.]